MTFANIRTLSLLLTVLFLAACSGGASTTANQDPIPVASCDPADPGTFDECGTVLIGFTDADGDFLTNLKEYELRTSLTTAELQEDLLVLLSPLQQLYECFTKQTNH